jgi:hypothetical protein
MTRGPRSCSLAHQETNSGMTSAGSLVPFLQASHASGWVFHHSMVEASWRQRGQLRPMIVSKLAEKVAIGSLGLEEDRSKAATPKDNIEFRPGAGPSASMSIDR